MGVLQIPALCFIRGLTLKYDEQTPFFHLFLTVSTQGGYFLLQMQHLCYLL